MFIRYENAETKEQAENECFESIGWIPAVTVECEGGWQCFQFVPDYDTWRNQC